MAQTTTLKEYFKAKIERQKVLLSYSASIDHAEYETVCDYDDCHSIKKKVEGISQKSFKWLKKYVDDEFTAIKAEISTIHEMVRMGFIPAWEGYNPHEHGIYNMSLVKSDIPPSQLHSIVWKEIKLKRANEIKQPIITATEGTQDQDQTMR